MQFYMKNLCVLMNVMKVNSGAAFTETEMRASATALLVATF